MERTPAQLAQYGRDGFLIFPDLFTPAEIAVLRQDVVRLAKLDTEAVFRAHTGGVKSIFRVHEEDGAIRSTPFRALARTPHVLRRSGGARHRWHTPTLTPISARPGVPAARRQGGDGLGQPRDRDGRAAKQSFRTAGS